MQGYLLPIVLAGLLAVPLLWRIGSDVTDDPATLAENPKVESPKAESLGAEGPSTEGSGTENPGAEAQNAADDAESESLKLRSFSIGDSEVQVEFSTFEDFLAREREAFDLQRARFNKTDAE